MLKVKMVAITAMLAVFMVAGTGVASARLAWCEVGCPPPMEAGLVERPVGPDQMPTPLFKNANDKFDSIGSTLASDTRGGEEVNEVEILLPPGMDKAGK